MPSYTKTRTRRDRGGDEIEMTYYVHECYYVIISYLSRDSMSMTRLMKFLLHTESRLQSPDVPFPPRTSGPRDYLSPCSIPQGGYMTSEQISLVRKQLYHLFQVIRKEAVPLVDAFDIPDEILNSVLGRYDGDVYTHLYEWALKAPRNKKQVS